MRTHVAVSALLLAALVPLVPPAAAADHTVTANDFAWTPNTLSIGLGQSVEFVLGGGTHNWVPDFEAEACSLPCTITFTTEGSYPYHCGFHPSMSGTVLVGTPPVATITSPAAGATVSGLVRVEGTASHATASFAGVTVRIGDGDVVSATLSGSGPSVTWSADVPSNGAANGAQSIVAVATTTGGLIGQATRIVTVNNPISVDIVMIGAGAQPAATTSNGITFTMRNDGNVAASVVVLAEYFYHGTWRTIGTTTVAVGLTGNAPGSIVWRPATPNVGAFTVRVTADPGELLPDPQRSNNARTTTAGWFTSLVPGIVPTEPV